MAMKVTGISLALDQARLDVYNMSRGLESARAQFVKVITDIARWEAAYQADGKLASVITDLAAAHPAHPVFKVFKSMVDEFIAEKDETKTRVQAIKAAVDSVS